MVSTSTSGRCLELASWTLCVKLVLTPVLRHAGKKRRLMRGSVILVCVAGCIAAIASLVGGGWSAGGLGGAAVMLQDASSTGDSAVHSTERMEEARLRLQLKEERTARMLALKASEHDMQKRASSKAASSLAAYDVMSFGDGDQGVPSTSNSGTIRRDHPSMQSMQARLAAWKREHDVGGAARAGEVLQSQAQVFRAPSAAGRGGQQASHSSSLQQLSSAAASYLSGLLGSLGGSGEEGGGSRGGELRDVLRGDIAGLRAFAGPAAQESGSAVTSSSSLAAAATPQRAAPFDKPQVTPDGEPTMASMEGKLKQWEAHKAQNEAALRVVLSASPMQLPIVAQATAAPLSPNQRREVAQSES